MDPPVRQQYEKRRQALDEASDQQTQARAQGELGMWFQAYRFFQSAEIAYRNALGLDPENPRWLYYHAVTLLRLERTQEARLAFETVLEQEAHNVPALVRLAELEIENGELETADQRLLQALELDPGAARALVARAAVARQRGDWDEVVEHLEQALAQQPGSTQIRYELGLAHQRLGNRQRGRALLSMVQRAMEATEGQLSEEGLALRDPRMEEIQDLDIGSLRFVRSGRQAARAGRYGQAVGFFEKALESNPDVVNAALGLARALTAEKRRQEAETVYRQALERFPDEARVPFGYGNFLLQAERFEEAEALFRRSLELDGKLVQAHRALARMLERKGKSESAAEHLRLALELEPDHFSTRERLARGLLARGKDSEARTVLEAAKATAEGRSVHLLLARLLALSPRPASRDLETARELAEAAFSSRSDLEAAEVLVLASVAMGRAPEGARCMESLSNSSLLDSLGEDERRRFSTRSASLRSGVLTRDHLLDQPPPVLFVDPALQACRAVFPRSR